MNRRQLFQWGFTLASGVSGLFASDYFKSHPLAWQSSSIDTAVIALYGKEKFAGIKKSTQIALIVPHVSISNPDSIPIVIQSTLKARTVALFYDTNPQSLIAVFDVGKEGIIDYALHIRVDIKGTLFAVIEALDGQLYYARAYLDIAALSCMSSDE